MVPGISVGGYLYADLGAASRKLGSRHFEANQLMFISEESTIVLI
jgi:hypothetical protein